MNELHKRIYVAGHRGMVGGAIVRSLQALGHDRIITRTHAELDLTDQAAVRAFFAEEKPEEVYLAAAKVGGIHANATYPAEFLYANLMLEANVVHEAWRSGVTRLLFLGSSCIYPRLAAQPMAEDALLTGKLEPTNEPYAIAKIAGIKLCESYNRQYGCDYRSVMPTNLYGPCDSYHVENGHVIPALMRRLHQARLSGAAQVAVWGTGEARREFLYVDDLAKASLFLLENYDSPETINVGVGEDLPIHDLAQLVADTVGFEGELVQDPSKPDGTPRKLLDVSRLNDLGWKASTGLGEGIASTYGWYLDNFASVRAK